MKIRFVACSIFLSVLSFAANQSALYADIVAVYGDFTSDTVEFVNVREINEDDEVLYGGPLSTNGDTLSFGADGFISESLGNNSLDVLDGRLSFDVQARSGFLIDSITVQEFGSFTVIGDQSAASVRADGFATVNNVITSGSLLAEEFGPAAPFQNSGLFSEEFTISGLATSGVVRFDVDNRLNTAAFNTGGNTNSSAFIDKKGFNVIVNTIPVAVPEPASAVVSLLALGMLSVRRRRTV